MAVAHFNKGGHMAHRLYAAIVRAVGAGRLGEPFSAAQLQRSCQGFSPSTYSGFLSKHARGNPGANSELFMRVAEGRYRLIRPFKYGLEKGGPQ